MYIRKNRFTTGDETDDYGVECVLQKVNIIFGKLSTILKFRLSQITREYILFYHIGTVKVF